MENEIKTTESNETQTNETTEKSEDVKEDKSVEDKSVQSDETSENLKVAVAKYREELKKYKGVDPEEYKKLVEERQQAEEKEKMRKWKYEELLNEYKSKLDEAKKYEDFYNSNVQREQGKLEWLIQNITEEKREFVNKIISKTNDVFEKVEIVSELIPTFKKPDFSSAPWSESKSTDIKNDLEQAKAKGDISWLIANARPLN